MEWWSDGVMGKPNTPTLHHSSTPLAVQGKNGFVSQPIWSVAQKGAGRILRLVGRAELPLCPEFLGGAAAPPYRITEEICPAPGRKNRIALARAFAQYPPMLARVLSAAVNGIEAFPVEVKVHCGWGDTIIANSELMARIIWLVT